VLGPIITQLFSWFATGEYSLKTLAGKAYAEGFRFRKSGNKVPVATLHKILRKRIYTGEFDYAGVRYRGIHDPLVTLEVWNRVQEILDGRQRRRHQLDRPFLYSGLIRCGHCGCSLVAELKKRRYAYYHCTGYRGNCGEPYAREERLDRHFATLLRALVVAPAILQWLTTELVESDRAEEVAREEGLRRYRAESDRLGARLDVVYEDRLDGRIDAATYDRKFREIRDLDKAVRKKLEMIDQELRIPTSQALDLITRTAAAADRFAEASTAERRQLLDTVVGEAQWKGGELRCPSKSHLKNSDYRTAQVLAITAPCTPTTRFLISGGAAGIRSRGRVFRRSGRRVLHRGVAARAEWSRLASPDRTLRYGRGRRCRSRWSI
jgi:site-specific DNA recombinase